MPQKKTEKKPAPFTDEQLDEMIAEFLAIEGPIEKLFSRINKFVQFYFKPSLYGTENIPEGPTLFVGNHGILGMDGAVLMPTMYYELGRFIRSTGDNAWFGVEKTAKLLKSQGMVLAHPKVVSALMEDGQDILVYPGGAAEANKSETQKYELVWKERTGFVRMAAQHNYTITPFAIIGPDDWYEHRMEGPEILDSWVGKLMEKRGINMREDLMPPFPKGVMGGLLPKPQPTYIAFGKPISIPEYKGRTIPKKLQHSVRDQTAEAVKSLIGQMLLKQAQQKHKQGRVRRWMTR